MASSQEFLRVQNFTRRNYNKFLVFAKRKLKSKEIYSLACDEKSGFGAFFMKGYSTKQSIVKSTDNMQKKCR